MEKDIFQLELHAEIIYNDFSVMRVPGGWIYTQWFRPESGIQYISTFVPFQTKATA